MLIACPLAFGEVGVKERVKGVLNYKKPAFWVVTVSVVVCILVAACFLTDPGVVLSRNADKVESIVVFDGNTGRGLNITDRAEIEKIIEYVNEMKLHRSRISVGYTGYRFRIAFYPSGSAHDSFILNSPDTVRKDPFFYTVEGETGLYEYLEQLYEAAPDNESYS